MSGGVAEQRAVVSKRVEYIELLRDVGPLEPRDFVDRLDHSRSTVTRALGELREAGLVTREHNGYEATIAATMAAEEYRRHEATSRDILEASDLLEPLPETAAPPPQLLADARTHLTEPSAPFRPLETVSDRLRAAATVRVYLPTLVNPSLLRLWRRRVTAEELDSVGLFDDGLLMQLQGQYPEVVGEMGEVDAFSAYTVDGPPYALMLTTEDDIPIVTMVVYDGEGGVRGVVVNDSPAAVAWARARLEDLEAESTTADDTLRASAALHDETSTASPAWQPTGQHTVAKSDDADVQALPVDLKTEGFVRLSADYFDAHDRAPPEMSWQTGFTLAEVRAGHAVDRLDESGQPFVDRLLRRLRRGDDHVLLGPPGAGKSTTCMAVACEWFERGLGPVLYRERGAGDEFTATSLLEAYLRQVDGHALVVVEDAVRRETNAIFELLRVLGGREDVTFLLDSRQTEWNEADDPDLDPRVGAVRRTAVEEVYMPELDDDGYERFARHFDRLVGDESATTPSGDDLQAAVADDAGQGTGDATEPGTALLAQAQLSRAHMPAADRERGEPDTLAADIAETYRSLSDDPPDLATDLAVLVNLLNAAGIPVAAEYLYALPADGQRGEIETAISRLEGKVLFAQQNARRVGTEYRTRHEEWSRRFLAQLLELCPAAEARASFGRCVTRFLALADDGGQRAKIQRQLTGATPHLRRIEADPTGWADEVTKRVFVLGQSHSQLAPLYGLTDNGTIHLPEACSAFVRQKQAWWRADMNGYQGATERAKSEIERLTDVEASGDGVSEDEAKRLRFHGHRGLSMYNRVNGDNDTASDHASRALALARDLEEIYKIAQAYEVLVGIESRGSNLELAREHLDELRDLADKHDTPAVEARAIRSEGRFLLIQGEYGNATRRLHRAVEQGREAHGNGTAVYALTNLSYVALAENDFELAESSLSSALEIARTSGHSMRLCAVYSMLAHLARKRGHVEDAAEYLQQAAEYAADVPRLTNIRLRSLALLEQAQGNLTAAADIAGEAVASAAEIDGPLVKMDALWTLGQILIQKEEFREAERYLEQGRERMEQIDNQVKLATCDRLRARLEFERGNPDEAERFAHEALQTFDTMEIADEAADCRRVLGLATLERGEISEAREQLVAGLASAEESGVVRQVAQLHEAMGRLEFEAGKQARARQHQEQAIETFERLGDTDRAKEVRARLVE